ncbi:hypothetical protein POTOM_059613 [Populus tomentosa]|uniref:Uncharacterized protein n=1 Tax=Populus tomentosa TaxID=118781 RepID=A0A8X8C1R3_POPTO|nr:hypothetical protein POTOM_059613 [Populus tomentosa]
MGEGGKNTLPTTILYMIMAGTAFFPLMITCNWDGRLVDVVDNVAGEEVFAVAAVSGRVSDDGFVVSTSEVMVDFVKMRICLGLQMVEFAMLVIVAAAVVKVEMAAVVEVEMAAVLKVEMHCCSSTLCYDAYPGRLRICLVFLPDDQGLQMVEFVMLVAVAAAVVKVEMRRCSSTLCYHAYPGRNWVEEEESLVETR